MVGWVGFQEGWRTYEADFVRFELPRGMNCGPVGPGRSILCRGEFAPGSPAAILVSLVEDRRPPGRTHEELHVEEGLAFDYLERRDAMVVGPLSVIVRTIAADDHHDTVERILASVESLE